MSVTIFRVRFSTLCYYAWIVTPNLIGGVKRRRAIPRFLIIASETHSAHYRKARATKLSSRR